LKKKQPKNVDLQNNTATAAVLEERRRIHRELHDRVLQLLSSIRLRAEVCRRELTEHPEALEQELQTIERTTDKAITEIRLLLADSQTQSDLIAGTLERRLREELEIFRARAGLKLDFQCEISPHSLPLEVERELYFALREGVINAIRHSRATELKLRLSRERNTYRATLQDNGSGFDFAATEGGSHYGLRIMRERIQNVDGHLAIDTAPGKGTRVSIDIPIKKKKRERTLNEPGSH
jgi:two-component system, NarL family, sensor histidine kinase LiaS